MSIYNTNCFDTLPTLADNSVDLILIDPPFGITACVWDKKPCFDTLYKEFKRILKPNGVCIIFGDFKLLADLQTTSFRKHYSHQIVWSKLRTSNQLNAKKRPLQANELINVYNFGKVKYNPQYFYGWNKKKEWVFSKPTDPKDNEIVESHKVERYGPPKWANGDITVVNGPIYGSERKRKPKQEDNEIVSELKPHGGNDPKYYDTRRGSGLTGKKSQNKDNEIVSELKLSPRRENGLTGTKTNSNMAHGKNRDKKVEAAKEGNATCLYEGEYEGNGMYNKMQIPATYTDPGYRYPTTIAPFQKRIGKSLHPTEKPVHLLEWLIKSYSDEDMVVLDCFMGSGSCGEAALNTNREFIGVEIDETFFNVAKNRLEQEI
jgi:DNA modification methylase